MFYAINSFNFLFLYFSSPISFYCMNSLIPNKNLVDKMTSVLKNSECYHAITAIEEYPNKKCPNIKIKNMFLSDVEQFFSTN